MKQPVPPLDSPAPTPPARATVSRDTVHLKNGRTRAVYGTAALSVPKPPVIPPRTDDDLRDAILAEPIPNLPARESNKGPETDLTPELARIILAAIRAGSYQGTAAEWAGVPADTMYDWMRRKTEPYLTFQRDVRKAEAQSEVRGGLAIISKVDNNPHIALAFLERRFPHRWGRVNALPPGSLNVSFDLGSALEKIAARVFEDPRGPRPARRIVIDAEQPDA